MALYLATSLAIVMMNAGGLAVAIRDNACLAVRQASARGLSGRPKVMLKRERQNDGYRKH